jgi:hypothetical protein
MKSNQLFYGSLDLTTLIELAKKKHSAFTKGSNGKIYASINIWLNSEVDKFGNIMSVQVNPSKEMKEIEDRVYIGNLKQSEGPKPITDRDAGGLDTDFDVPQRQTNSGAATNSNPPGVVTEPIDDLPF